MLELIDEVFETRKDPGQIQVSPQQLKKLQEIHPATLTELADENGPLIWILLIPTTRKIMEEFVTSRISEKALLDKTRPGDIYDCIYLCSATTLPEYRGKGKTMRLCLDAIDSILADHPVRTLFVWPFTVEGDRLAETIAKASKLELLKREV